MSSQTQTDPRGTLCAVATYVMWGLFPLYWPLLKRSGALEILAHRMVWSAVIGVALVAVLAPRWRAKFASRRTRLFVFAASATIAVNWGTYIWAVNNGHVTEAALGYYINPIFSILLGVIVLGERLVPIQWAAIALAAVAVVILTVEVGRLPWVAVALAGSFGIYGLIKKQISLDAATSFAAESVILSLPAAAYLTWLSAHGGDFIREGAGYSVLLMSTGVVTAAPLLLFSWAAPRISLSTMGMIQYIGPTLQFILGVFVFHEHMSPARWSGFILVWIALVVLTTHGVWRLRRTRRRPSAG